MANIITGLRIICSVALLFFPAFSPAFYALYIAAGLSDMIDGAQGTFGFLNRKKDFDKRTARNASRK